MEEKLKIGQKEIVEEVFGQVNWFKDHGNCVSQRTWYRYWKTSRNA